MQQFTVSRTEADNFARVWTHNGIALPMNDAHIAFATDFANIVLKNFIDMCKQQATVAQKQAVPERKLIVEGV